MFDYLIINIMPLSYYVVGHVGYPQSRAHNIHFVGNVGHYLNITHNAHNLHFFGKGLGTRLQSVGHVGNLDSHFKSLAYNICADTIYKIQPLAIYPFIITHNTHKLSAYGSHGRLALPTTLPTTSPKHSKTTHNMTRTRTLLQTVKELLAD
jgi:hypothetical protein